jgi:hypothetical protein
MGFPRIKIQDVVGEFCKVNALSSHYEKCLRYIENSEQLYNVLRLIDTPHDYLGVCSYGYTDVITTGNVLSIEINLADDNKYIEIKVELENDVVIIRVSESMINIVHKNGVIKMIKFSNNLQISKEYID